jgi:hypothetical protein
MADEATNTTNTNTTNTNTNTIRLFVRDARTKNMKSGIRVPEGASLSQIVDALRKQERELQQMGEIELFIEQQGTHNNQPKII